LDNPDAVDYGRDLHGFDKHLGILKYELKSNRFSFDIEADGRPVLRGSIGEHGGAVGQLRLVSELARAHGLFPTARLLVERQHRLAVITPRTVRQRRTDIFFRARPRLQPWSAGDWLEAGDEPRVGRLIAESGFVPEVVQRIAHGEGVMPLPLD
jgi:hypothetical protein